MAFQNVSIIGAPTPIIPVGVDAGPDQYAMCSTTVTLNATITIDPTDTELHNYQWEQTRGTPVNWLTSVYATSVTYDAVDSSDRYFRIYVDRFTLAERYDEVVVYGTPTSKSTMDASYTSYAKYDCRGATLYYIAYATSTGYFTPTTKYQLSWTLPTCDSHYLEEYQIQHLPMLGPWITFDVVPEGSSRISITPNTTSAFRILSIYRDGLHQPSNIRYDPSSGLSGIMVTASTMNASYTQSTPVHTVERLTLSTNQVTSVSTFANTYLPSIPTYAVARLTLDTNQVVSSSVMNDTYIPHVPVYEVSVLTGGNIGG